MKENEQNEDKSFPQEWKYLIITAVMAVCSGMLLVTMAGSW